MIKYLINRPIAVSMTLIAILVVGMIGINNIPVSLMPNIDIPQITVQANAPGYSVQEMEKKIVAPLRNQLALVPGIKSINSDARTDIGSILLRFEPGTDIEKMFIEVNEKIDMTIGNLPKDIVRPKVIKACATDVPAFYLDLSLNNEQPSQQASSQFAELCDFAKNIVCRRLEQLPPTAMVDICGTMSSEILCTPKDNELAATGITLDDLQAILTNNDIQLSALSVADGIYRYHIHFDNQLLTIEDVRNIFINHKGKVMKLCELCDIEEVSSTRKNIIRHNGKNCVTLAVIKQSDAQMDELHHAVGKLIDELKKDYPLIQFDITRDQTELLSYSIHNLEWNLLAVIFFTLLVLLFFMQKWRLALLVALSIPLSLVITLLCFKITNISLNIISLSGLILGVGMIVDNSIVVIDNILQKLQQGLTLTRAICKGTSEVFTAMLSAVLTTCSVFIPLIFIGGMSGALFFDQSMGITIALFSSLIVAMMVLPVYFKMLYSKVHISKDRSKKLFTPSLVRQHAILKWHDIIQHWMFHHMRLCIFLSLLTIPSIFGIFYVSEKRLMPPVDYSDGMMYVDWNRGISTSENDHRISTLLKTFPQKIETTTSMVGTLDFLLFHTKELTSSEALVHIKCKKSSDLEYTKNQIKSYMEERFPEASFSFSPSNNLLELIFSSKEPELCLNLQNNTGHRPSVEQVKLFRDALCTHFPNLNIPPLQTEEYLQLIANAELMNIYGISHTQLSERLRQLSGTNEVLRINHSTGKVPIIIGNSQMDRKHILSSTIKNKDGVDIPLNLLLKERMMLGFKHYYGSEIGEYEPIALDVDRNQAKEILDFSTTYEKKHDDIKISHSGNYFSSQKMVIGLVGILIVSLLLLFFILAVQFESLMQPIIILSEIAIDICIVLHILWFLNIPLDIMSMIGFIVMSGIVINDSILKIDTINMHRMQGMSLMDAIERTGKERLMPIIMTSITTIFSLLPFLSRNSIGAEIQFPLSLTILIGMVVGTFVSIFYVPLLYYAIYSRQQLIKQSK